MLFNQSGRNGHRKTIISHNNQLHYFGRFFYRIGRHNICTYNFPNHQKLFRIPFLFGRPNREPIMSSSARRMWFLSSRQANEICVKCMEICSTNCCIDYQVPNYYLNAGFDYLSQMYFWLVFVVCKSESKWRCVDSIDTEIKAKLIWFWSSWI